MAHRRGGEFHGADARPLSEVEAFQAARPQRADSAVRTPVIAALALLALLFAFPQTATAHGDLLLRISAVTRQIETATNNPAQLYLQRGELHRTHRSWDAAAADYTRAAQLDPQLASVDFCRAQMLADAGQLAESRTLLDQILVRCPTNTEALIGRARVLVCLGQCELAVADFRDGLEHLTSPTPEMFLELAQTLVTTAQTNEALAALDAGIKSVGFFFPLQAYALDLELGRANTNAALARLDRIIAQAARKESWLARRGDILIAVGQPGEARASFEAALTAVRRLPLRLQQGPSMIKLQAHVHAALTRLNNAQLPNRTGVGKSAVGKSA